MPLKLNPFTAQFDLTGSGGGGGGSAFFAGEVPTYADLPLDGTAALNSRWLVRSNSGTWPFSSYKQAGVYVRIATVGSSRDNDYRLTDTSFFDVMSDSAFLLFDDGDATRNLKFQLSGIPTASTVTLTAPAASGTIARTSDIPSTFAASAITSGTFDNARINFAAPPSIGNTTPSTGAFTTLSAAPTSGSALTLTGGTVTASAPLIDASQTWNASGTTFTGLRVNVTNTNSATASLLADFQVGGTTQFSIRRDGSSLGGYYRFTNLDAGLFVHSVGGSEVAFGASPNHWFTITSTRLRLAGDISLGRSGSAGQAVDTILVRDDVATLAQRNAANAQTFRLYNTFTDASNHERGFMRWSSNVLQIGTEKLGSGTARNLEFQTDGTTRLTIFTDGNATFTNNVTANNFVPQAGGVILWSTRSRMYSDADGNIRITNTSQTDFGRLQFGGTTSSFPALKRSSTTLQVRLADDSAFAPFACAGLTLNGDLTASTRNIVTDTTTGTRIGTGTTQLLGFWNATPAVQPAAVADATDAATVITQLNALLARLRTIGLIAT